MQSKRVSGKLVRDARGRFAEKRSSSAKKMSSSISMKSSKRSRSSMKSRRVSRKLARDAKGRFAVKRASGAKNRSRSVKSSRKTSSTKKNSSTTKGEEGGAHKTIYMPIQQASNGKTAEAIVIKNDESSKNKTDVTEVTIVEN